MLFLHHSDMSTDLPGVAFPLCQASNWDVAEPLCGTCHFPSDFCFYASGSASCVIAGIELRPSDLPFVVRAARGCEGRKEEQIRTLVNAPLPTLDAVTPARLHAAKRFLKSNKLNFICELRF